ncbi:hypothetical protein EOS_13420, partial [Caballeronia mineralivorans PML1(12)]
QQRSNALLLPDQDHRNIKSRTDVMLGFKRLRSAATTIAGIELVHRIRKGQFNLSIPGHQRCCCAWGLEFCPIQSLRYP